jgi:hypothetical protein
VAQVVAHKRKLRFLRIYPLNAANALHCLLLLYVAAKAIDCVGRINDYTARSQHIGHLTQQAGLWILRMHVYEHGLRFERWKEESREAALMLHSLPALVIYSALRLHTGL